MIQLKRNMNNLPNEQFATTSELLIFYKWKNAFLPKGETVALAMYWIAQTEKKGLTVYQSEEIELIGNNIYIEEI